VSAEGVFHDAHEVYAIWNDERQWVATFRTRDIATYFVTRTQHDDRPSLFPYSTLEVVPV